MVYNGDWTEQTPTRKSRMDKIISELYWERKKKLTVYSNEIEIAYTQAKQIAETAKTKPTVLSGASVQRCLVLACRRKLGLPIFKRRKCQLFVEGVRGNGKSFARLGICYGERQKCRFLDFAHRNSLPMLK